MGTRILNMWRKLPFNIRHKPLDIMIAILLIIYALAISGPSTFDPFDFLSYGIAFSMTVQVFVTSYLIFGSVLILYGIFFHPNHSSRRSFCHTELWGWRLLFSACSVIFIIEVVDGALLPSSIWMLQSLAAFFKMLQYYDERRLEQKIWTQ